MYKLNMNNTTYLVPLDGLDLSSIHRSFNIPSQEAIDPHRVKPLWTVPSGEEYYEFRLNAWRISEESEDEDITGLETESQRCHICNTYVPVMYIKEHNISSKHINMKKIHDLIARRGTNSDLRSSEQTPLENRYYCEECSIVILKKDKLSHVNTYTHKKSLRNKDLIEQFLKFYSEDLNETKIVNPMKGYFDKFLNKKNLKFKVSVVNDIVAVIINEYTMKIHINNFHGFVKMDDDLICILCEVQLQMKGVVPHIEGKKHRKKITRNMDDQHCIREMNEDFAHCLLCNELVLVTRVASHKLLTYHTSHLDLALGRKNRDFNKNHITATENGAFGHLSDELQSNNDESGDGNLSDEFDEGNSHGYETNKEITSEVNGNTQEKNHYCDVCSVYIDTRNFNNHMVSSTHKQLEFNKIKADVKCQQKIINIYKDLEMRVDDVSEDNDSISAHTKDTAEPVPRPTNDLISPLHYHMEESSYNIVNCRVCNIKMYIEDINGHIDHENHNTKYENLLKDNKIVKNNDFVSFCQVCLHPVFVKSVLDHIYSEQHMTNVNHKEKQETCLETNNDIDLHESKNDISCKAGDLKFCKEDIDDHTNREDHKNKYENLLQVHKIIKQNEFVCFCKVCNHPIFIKSVLDHVHSEQHKSNINNTNGDETNNNLNQVTNKNDCKNKENIKIQTNAEIDDSTENNSQVIVSDSQKDESQNQINFEVTEIPTDFMEKIKYQVNEINENIITCKVCNIHVSNNDLDIFKHFESKDHTTKYNELLKINRLTKAQNKYFCYACKASITNKNELDHIFGIKHKSKFPNLDIDAACKISCQINEGKISVTVQKSEKASVQAANNITDVKKDKLPMSKTTNEVVAKIDNAQAVFHKQYHLFTKTKNLSEVVCKVCNIILTNTIINIESHMAGSDHKRRYEILLKMNGLGKRDTGFYCQICQVYLSNKNELIHISGVKHINKATEYVLSLLNDSGIKKDILDETLDQINIDNSFIISNENGNESAAEIVGQSSDKKQDSDDNIDQTNVQIENFGDVQPTTEEIGNESTAEIVDQPDGDENIDEPPARIEKSEDLESENEAGTSNTNKQTYNSIDYEEIDQNAGIEKPNVEICDKSENGHASTGNINLQAPFSKPFHHVSKTTNPSEVQCKICNVILTNSAVNIETHLLGFNHINKYKILINSNGLRKENDRYFCEICNLFISNKNEVEHIMGYKHKARLPKDRDSVHNECEICNTNVPAYYMEKHLSSAEHLLMELMKETTAKMDAMMKKVQKLEQESIALRGRTARLAIQQGRR